MTSRLETISVQQGSNMPHLSSKENYDLFKPSSC